MPHPSRSPPSSFAGLPCVSHPLGKHCTMSGLAARCTGVRCEPAARWPGGCGCLGKGTAVARVEFLPLLGYISIPWTVPKRTAGSCSKFLLCRGLLEIVAAENFVQQL